VKIDNKYLQRLGVLPYEDTPPRTRAREEWTATTGLARGQIREFNFGIETQTVTEQPRRLEARWTAEIAEDLQNVHGIDAEEYLTQLMTESINERTGQLGEANRALDELVEEGQERGEYDVHMVEQPEESSAMRTIRQWMEAVRRNS
jgi:hypothetical protein